MKVCTCTLPSIHEPHPPPTKVLLNYGWDLFRQAETDGRIGYNGGGWWFLDGVRIRGQIETIVELLRETE